MTTAKSKCGHAHEVIRYMWDELMTAEGCTALPSDNRVKFWVYEFTPEIAMQATNAFYDRMGSFDGKDTEGRTFSYFEACCNSRAKKQVERQKQIVQLEKLHALYMNNASQPRLSTPTRG